MTEKNLKIIRAVCGIILSVFTLVIAALFLMQVLDIYSSGADNPFTRENVESHLSAISLPVWLWVGATVAVGIFNLIYPSQEKAKNTVNSKMAFNRVCGEIDPTINEFTPLKQRKTMIFIFKIATVGICLLGVIFTVIYISNVNNFSTKNLNGEVIAMIAKLLPFLFAAFACALALAIYEAVSAKKLMGIAKEGAKISKSNGYKKTEKTTKNSKIIFIVRIAIGVVAVAFIIIGIVNGGAYDVFQKAINICTECIGLG